MQNPRLGPRGSLEVKYGGVDSSPGWGGHQGAVEASQLWGGGWGVAVPGLTSPQGNVYEVAWPVALGWTHLEWVLSDQKAGRNPQGGRWGGSDPSSAR